MSRLAMIVSVALMAALIPSVALGIPERTVIEPEPAFFPAGTACTFDVSGEPDDKAWRAETEFDDGRIQVIGNGDPTFTNVETGTSIVHNSNYKLTQTYDPAANDLHFEVSGTIFLALPPGAVGPLGQVGPNGAFLSMTGHHSSTLDLDTFTFTVLSHEGTVTDLCALLAS